MSDKIHNEHNAQKYRQNLKEAVAEKADRCAGQKNGWQNNAQSQVQYAFYYSANNQIEQIKYKGKESYLPDQTEMLVGYLADFIQPGKAGFKKDSKSQQYMAYLGRHRLFRQRLLPPARWSSLTLRLFASRSSFESRNLWWLSTLGT